MKWEYRTSRSALGGEAAAGTLAGGLLRGVQHWLGAIEFCVKMPAYTPRPNDSRALGAVLV